MIGRRAVYPIGERDLEARADDGKHIKEYQITESEINAIREYSTDSRENLTRIMENGSYEDYMDNLSSRSSFNGSRTLRSSARHREIMINSSMNGLIKKLNSQQLSEMEGIPQNRFRKQEEEEDYIDFSGRDLVLKEEKEESVLERIRQKKSQFQSKPERVVTARKINLTKKDGFIEI
jgi:hypothetical protein